MLRIEQVETDKAALYARSELIKYLTKCKVDNTSVLLCLSGGSALELIKDFPMEILGSHVTITVLDERYSTDPKINNMAQIPATGFLDKATAAGCGIIDTRVKEGESIEEVVAGYHLALTRWMENNPDGKIVATAGMGPDGHTSGIIPGSNNFDILFGDDQKKLVVGYVAANQPEAQKMRITTTFAFLEKVAFAVMLVLGESKAEAMTRLLAVEGILSETPARIWRSSQIETVLVTDLKGVNVSG